MAIDRRMGAGKVRIVIHIDYHGAMQNPRQCARNHQRYRKAAMVMEIAYPSCGAPPSPGAPKNMIRPLTPDGIGAIYWYPERHSCLAQPAGAAADPM